MKRYAFDPIELRDIALRHVGKPVPQIAEDLENDLVDTYGDVIHPESPWICNPAGFVMYQVKMIFARPNEYIGIMGVPVPSTGHTGRNPVTYYDTILSGGSLNAGADELVPRKVTAGDFVVTRPREAFTAAISDHIFFLEYCRGPLATIMPFGLLNYAFGNLDFRSARQIVRTNMGLMLKSRGVPTPHTDADAGVFER